MQYGEASADVNRMEFLQVPNPIVTAATTGCFFGYFRHDHEMRVEPNPAKQPRCGIHLATPFMYIGKVDRGRQFSLSIWYDERGDWVERNREVTSGQVNFGCGQTMNLEDPIQDHHLIAIKASWCGFSEIDHSFSSETITILW